MSELPDLGAGRRGVAGAPRGARGEGVVERIYLLEDWTSPVVVPGAIDHTDEADAAFERFEAADAHVVRSNEPIASWPGVE